MKEKGIIIQSVDRALQILECFTGPIRELGITEISKEMGLGKSTVYGLVNTLMEAGYLEQNPDNKRYRLGLKLFIMGSLVQGRMDIREIAKPHLKSLAERFQMTVHMGLYRDGEVVYIDKQDSPNARVIYSQVGKLAPMYCTGIGKAVFANLPESERDFLLSNQIRRALTINTKIDEAIISEELQRVLIQGYAVDDQEVELGLRCIAAPIFDGHRKVVAAISVSSSTAMLHEENMDEIAQEVKQVAFEISKQLGYY